MIKYSKTRYHSQPKVTEYQQTNRYILPLLYFWKDGYMYHSFGIGLAWWKWEISILFDIY